MKLYFNHIPKCGGMSISKMLSESSKYKHFHVRAKTTLDELNYYYSCIANEKNVIIQGHFFDPAPLPFSVVSKFWSSVYLASDVPFSIVRYPAERFISYLKYSGRDKTGNPSYQFLFNGMTKGIVEVEKLLSFWHGRRDCEDINTHLNILTKQNSLINALDSINYARAFNEYPLCLGAGSNCLKHLSLRSDNPIAYIRELNSSLHSNQILEFLGCKKYKLFPLEAINTLVDFFKDNGIISRDSYLSHENKTNNRSYGNPDIKLLQNVVHEFPESTLLWKYAFKNL